MSQTICKTHYLENKLLSARYNNQSYSVAATYIGLLTTAASKSSAGVECSTSGTSYARQLLAPVLSGGNLVLSPQDSTGSTISFATVTWAAATGSGFGTVVGVGIYDASSGGNLLEFQDVTSTTIGVGVVATFAAGNLTVLEA